MIHLECPGCAETVSVEDSLAGQSADCPNCGTKFGVPPEVNERDVDERDEVAPNPQDEQVEVTPCPGCKARIAVARVDLGTVVECPYCVTQFVAASAEKSGPMPRRKPRHRRDADGTPVRLSRRAEDDNDLDDEEDERPRRRRRSRRDADDGVPGNLKTIGVLQLIGGIYAIMHCLGLVLGTCFCAFWPGVWLGFVWAILAIIRGAAMMNGTDRSPTPPTVLLTLQILLIMNCDIMNMILGIVALSMANNEDVQNYYATNADAGD